MQLSYILVAALAAVPSVVAHGKVAAVTGDAGGNGTALGIQGGVVPGPGKNAKTEVDTTVFKSTNIATDGLGKTKAGTNTLADMTAAMAASGSTLPQVSDGGSITGTLHIVTTDGAGPYKAMVDSTGTGAFSQGTEADVTQQVPGNKGNIKPDGTVKNKVRGLLVKMGVISARAANVNMDYPFTIQIPAGTTCTGTAGGQTGVCMVKMANANPAGPFGGVFAIQMVGGASNATSTAASSTSSTASAAKGGKASKDKANKRAALRAASALV